MTERQPTSESESEAKALIKAGIPVLSPSQIEQWVTCKRKWAWRYIDGIPAPPSPSTKVGLRVHKILEEYLRDGKAPNREESLAVQGRHGRETYYPGMVALSMLKHLPPAGSQPWVEKHFLVELGGIWFQGYRDLLRPGIVNDHKTTKDLGGGREDIAPLPPTGPRVKRSGDLLTDPQAILYAAASFVEGLDLNGRVACQWVYGQTKSRYRSRLVEASFTEQETLEALEKHVLPPAREILELYRTRPGAKTLDPTIRSCDLYGGCPYRSNCNLSGKDKLVSMMSGKELMDKLRARKETQAAPEAPNPSPKLTKLRPAQEQTKDDPADQPPPPPPKLTKLRPKGINPPDAPEPSKTAPAPEVEPSKTAPAPEVEPSKTAPAPHTFTLYVDCEPVRARDKVQAMDLLAAAAAKVESDAQVPHWSLIDYGKGAGYLAAQLKEDLIANPPGSVVLTTRYSPEGKATLQVLMELASEIVIGR